MANFQTAWNITKQNESGYSNDPNDIGGETYRGISRKYNPNWIGWVTIDGIKKTGAKIPTNFTQPNLDKYANDFYQSIHWKAILGSLIKDQDTANILFDQAVIGGVPRTNDFIKDVLNKRFGATFKLNGLPEVKAIEFLNKVKQAEFISTFNNYRRKFFAFSAGKLSRIDPLYPLLKKYNKTTEAKKKENERYLAGWIKRVDKYQGKTGENRLNDLLTAATFVGFGMAIEKKL